MSSWLARSGRVIALKPTCPFGFSGVANDDSPSPHTEDLLRYGTGYLGNLMDSLAPLQHIPRALPRLVELSNRAVRVLDVSPRADGGRRIFSRISLGDELRVWRCSERKLATAVGTIDPQAARPRGRFDRCLVQWWICDNEPCHSLTDRGIATTIGKRASASIPVRERIYIVKLDLRLPSFAPT